MTFDRVVVIDCRAHLLGRLASLVAKEVLSGQKVVLVRCEELNISGELFRNKLKWEAFLRKRTAYNPKRGPFHFRSPADFTRRVIRGMIPHKTQRGAAAMRHLHCFVGIPFRFQKIKRVVLPSALRITHLRPGRKFTRLGDLAVSIGWKYSEVVKKLETKRKLRGKADFKAKKATALLRKKSVSQAAKEIKKQAQVLQAYKYPVN
eukprot:c15682_g1_i2.p1 GENE.c15682_g1_i2~~c15682_g1_i2.p1  ORF type:complete len:205 (-),score=53.70 c15682_g1_i2:135-749(-)